MASWKVLFVTLLVCGYSLLYTSPLNVHNMTIDYNVSSKIVVTENLLLMSAENSLTENLKIDTISNLSKLFEMSSVNLRKLFDDSTFLHASTVQRIMYYSTLGVGTPYMLSSLGEGPLGAYDKDPLVDLTRVDCMTFCEQILALSITNSYDDFIRTLQKIRYAGKVVDIKERNHFVIADWLPNNSWLVEDITQIIGGDQCQLMTKTINRREFLATLGCLDTAGVSGPEPLSQYYIPKNSTSGLAAKLQNGDIVCLATHKKGLFVTHMGFLIKNDLGEVLYRNASRFGRKVIDESFDHLIDRMNKHKSIAGLIILRVRPNFTLK